MGKMGWTGVELGLFPGFATGTMDATVGPATEEEHAAYSLALGCAPTQLPFFFLKLYSDQLPFITKLVGRRGIWN
jgi:hypothetical protein